MADSRMRLSLRVARARAGWSREELAYRSGLSWSAIAQIESGRRKDVRLSSLAALADALGVSADFLIGTEALASAPQLFEHRVLAYGADEEFVAYTVPYLDEGLRAGDCVLAVTAPPKTALIREVLGDDSTQIEFADWADWYESPTSALNRYGEFVKRQIKAGAVWIRVVAEAAWTDGHQDQLSAWARYESLVNLAFAASPATILCTYDVRAFPREAITQAHATHPEVVGGQRSKVSAAYRRPEDFLLVPLPSF